ncbi:SMP-30/gluconolactonase/LRE family protein [Halomonas sp. McH1-25]|uniref:SMP-30/gluconolactonase/LRE family protein n=1 Tax=unclassified Halomonas TaxID=2609666 RepID=UPI001EF570FF|nr:MULTISPECIES: SMP-30/gluconolactonase/LRE family protein [unclassified Halomonas]MCG7601068.1 SMP-30/gluconolactonase/LRE family protein [Halomonas sp. McH1-25]MCP1343857.1 SMP-30/gluconolactonase/LRE family protein [Halomonas sp. FL8]MCP1361232.1 SMP-30/gluconolactonase/LRE family protein [Halomonas sp. BBD45]MCP1366402.1 SMP-30/gluconolactonase/LRE family protein [Halomonas sp. BBD48]
MPSSSVEVAVRLQMSLGECPLWSVDEQTLYWVDIRCGRVFAWSLESDEPPATWDLDEPVGCIALARNGLVAATASALRKVSRDGTVSSESLALNPEWSSKGNRFNDGRCDALGRLWVGTIDRDEVSPSAALYCLTNGQLQLRKDNLVISNGLAFSPDQRWLYHTDSLTRRVVRHAFDLNSGTLGEAEPWIDLAEQDLPGVPDGAAIDCEGHYWCALYDGGQVVRFSPAGQLVERYDVPCPHPTMLAFGGSEQRTLYITTATQHLDEAGKRRWPLAGSLFQLETAVPGLPEPRFAE